MLRIGVGQRVPPPRHPKRQIPALAAQQVVLAVFEWVDAVVVHPRRAAPDQHIAVLQWQALHREAGSWRQYPPQRADFLPQQGARHVHIQSFHAALQPALAFAHSDDGFIEVAAYRGAIGLFGLGYGLAQQGQGWGHHRQINQVAAENAVINTPVGIGQQLAGGHIDRRQCGNAAERVIGARPDAIRSIPRSAAPLLCRRQTDSGGLAVAARPN